MMESVSVAIIGAGNVAWSLAKAIDCSPGHKVTAIIARRKDRAQALASTLDSALAVEIDSGELPGAHIYILCVSDAAIHSLATTLRGSREATWIHTAGSVPLDALAPLGSRLGVIYPLQTFSKEKVLDLHRIPLYVESTPQGAADVNDLASALSTVVHTCDSDRRRVMHVAAVFGCNFVNHMLFCADSLLRKNGQSIADIEPLVRETIDKAFTMSPADAQTGPARRNDRPTIEAHRRTLDPNLLEIYDLLSGSIIGKYNK